MTPAANCSESECPTPGRTAHGRESGKYPAKPNKKVPAIKKDQMYLIQERDTTFQPLLLRGAEDGR